jgi:hypothetical protein
MIKEHLYKHCRDVLSWTCDENGNILGCKGQVIGSKCKNGYIYLSFRIDGKREKITAHRFVFYLHNSIVPNLDIDHINRVRTDNRISNLRVVNRTVNLHNNDGNGFYFNKTRGKWQAYIGYKTINIYLGLFDCQEDARKRHLEAKSVLLSYLEVNPNPSREEVKNKVQSCQK